MLIPVWIYRLSEPEKLRLYSHLELRLYSDHHMGSLLVVSPNPNTVAPLRDIELTHDISMFNTGLTK